MHLFHSLAGLDHPLNPESQVDWVQWQEERRQLGKLRQTRVLQLRFRQQPESHLAALEARLVKLSLPP
jgi:hypothetical protein